MLNGPAEILAHQFEILLRPQTPDLQGLPPAHGRRLRRAERYARTRRGRRHGDFKGWGGGGGNTLKIKHAGNLMTGYLHLSGYAKGIVKGSRVSQGQLIGDDGSTGASTGPHLDYRVWKNGTPIDPLKIPSEPAESDRQGEPRAVRIRPRPHHG